MEVATLFTKDLNIFDLFGKFIYGYDKLEYTGRDEDTAFFSLKGNSKHDIYYHFKLNDTEKEFSYNYSESEIEYVRKIFGDSQIFSVDISCKDIRVFNQLLEDFKEYLRSEKRSKIELIISDPFKGMYMLL